MHDRDGDGKGDHSVHNRIPKQKSKLLVDDPFALVPRKKNRRFRS